MRTLAAVLLAALVVGCSGDGETKTERASSDGEESYCVAYVRLHAYGAVEASRAQEVFESGGQPETVHPAEWPEFKRFLEAAPDEIKDDLKVAVKVPPPSQSEFETASKAITARLGKDCFIGEGAESPLSGECTERSVAVQQALAANADEPDSDLEAFGRECRPESDPYESLSDECAAMVYGFFTSPSVEGIVNVGGPTGDDEQAVGARFHQDCN